MRNEDAGSVLAVPWLAVDIARIISRLNRPARASRLPMGEAGP